MIRTVALRVNCQLTCVCSTHGGVLIPRWLLAMKTTSTTTGTLLGQIMFLPAPSREMSLRHRVGARI
jgi:hypothetical protein